MIDFNDLDTPLTPARKLSGGVDTARASIVNGGEAGYEQVTCPKCNGRGSKTYGYVNITSYPCKMCKTTGKVTAKRVANVERAIKASNTARVNLANRAEQFRADHADVVEFVRANADWSDFYRSMSEAIDTYGHLTERQLSAVHSGMEKAAARKAAKAAEKTAAAPVVEVSVIENLFAAAASNGLKRPVFRAMDGIEVSLAPVTGRNAGALYVKENGNYAGKIVSGRYLATREASAAVLPRLLAVAADPLGQATLFGKQTGKCCCCGRELTDPVSVENGIGPICAGKWGL